MTKDKENMHKIFRKTTIYVVRCDTEYRIKDSAPCENCLTTIKSLNIKRIVYSNGNNEFTSCHPCDVNQGLLSSGTKYLQFRR